MNGEAHTNGHVPALSAAAPGEGGRAAGPARLDRRVVVARLLADRDDDLLVVTGLGSTAWTPPPPATTTPPSPCGGPWAERPWWGWAWAWPSGTGGCW